MSNPRHLRLTASSGVLLALAGVWLGHGVEYLRVWGGAGLGRALTGSAHAYMLPVGAMLAVLAALMARRAWISWQRLAQRLDAAAMSLRIALRGGRPPLRGDVATLPSWPSRILSLAVGMALLQVCLYLLQENVEALAAGLRAPGFAAITGVHWAAALIQMDVAFLILAAVTFAVRRFAARTVAVRTVEALLRALAAGLRPAGEQPARALMRRRPSEWLGDAVWSRPPPLVTVAA